MLPKKYMKKISVLLSAFLLIWATVVTAQTKSGYMLLFDGTKSNLSEQEKKDIFSELDFTVSDTEDKLLYGEEPASPQVEIVDLNGDRIPEVFVSYGKWTTCGHAGACLALFVKNSKGKYEKVFDVPAIGWEKLNTYNLGFPDIDFVAPGFCRGIWRWNGVKYEHFMNMPEVEGDWRSCQ